MANMHQQPFQGGIAPAPAAFQQSTPSIPADILGLADKAASAVQALQASRSSAPGMNMSSPPQMMAMQPMPGQAFQGFPPNNFSSYSNPVASSQPPPFRRGRATATMGELPVMVQYAVQVSFLFFILTSSFAFEFPSLCYSIPLSTTTNRTCKPQVMSTAYSMKVFLE